MLDRMVASQAHRGPDSQGRWLGTIGAFDIALGHNRLAIIDLSVAAGQPMVSVDGRYILVFNGEIYNYIEIRAQLELLGARFKTESDTEVLLNALAAWGDGALEKFNGMWAFGLLDRVGKRLLLARDRFGVKPLYYYLDGRGRFYFSSEIKGILAGSREKFDVAIGVVGGFLGQSQKDAQSQTFFSGINALLAGHCLQLDLSRENTFDYFLRRYWKTPELDLFRGTIQERILEVRDVFFDAVKLRLRSDVPVGVLLSGGVDSSSIVAAMQHILPKGAQIEALSATSDDPRYNEEPFIDRVSAHLRCSVQKVVVDNNPERAFELFAKCTRFNDEPIGTFACLAHFQLMERAKQLGITVILSGQGSDEILCGYTKYMLFYVQTLLRHYRWDEALSLVAHCLAKRTVLTDFQISEAKRYLPRRFRMSEVDIRGPRLKEADYGIRLGLEDGGIVERQLADLERFSIPAIVHYEDRMSMAQGREIRLPFLDYRLVSLLVPLDPTWKLREGWTKWIFRKAIEPFLPRNTTWRRDKKGFTNPEPRWLKRDFRQYIERLLNEPMLVANAGIVNQVALRRAYRFYCEQGDTQGWLSYKDILNPIALEIWANCFQSSLKLKDTTPKQGFG